MSASIYEQLRDLLRAEEPVALATVVDGPQPGAKLLVRPDGEPLGELGDSGLDRVVYVCDLRDEGRRVDDPRARQLDELRDVRAVIAVPHRDGQVLHHRRTDREGLDGGRVHTDE